MRQLLGISSLALLLAGGCASWEVKDQGPPLVTPAPYVQLAGLYAWEDDFDLDDGLDADESWGLDARIGGRVHENLAIELEYQWLTEFGIDDSSNKEVGTIDGYTLTGNLRAYLPIDRYFHPYALAGVGGIGLDFDPDEGSKRERSDYVARLGIGLDTNLSENFTVTIEGSYNRPWDDLEDYAFWSAMVGLMVRF